MLCITGETTELFAPLSNGFASLCQGRLTPIHRISSLREAGRWHQVKSILVVSNKGTAMRDFSIPGTFPDINRHGSLDYSSCVCDWGASIFDAQSDCMVSWIKTFKAFHVLLGRGECFSICTTFRLSFLWSVRVPIVAYL